MVCLVPSGVLTRAIGNRRQSRLLWPVMNYDLMTLSHNGLGSLEEHEETPGIQGTEGDR